MMSLTCNAAEGLHPAALAVFHRLTASDFAFILHHPFRLLRGSAETSLAGKMFGMLNGASNAGEAELVGRIAAGDQRALNSAYATHHLRIFHFLLRFMKDRSAAEDVLAEVFIDLWQQAGRFEGRSSLNTWLCAVARNKALSHMRKYPPPVDDAAMSERADLSDTPEHGLQKLDKSQKLRACLTKLSPEHSQIIELVYYHDKTVQEVSGILDIPVATVKTRMFYARKRLSDIMREAGIDRGWP